MSTTATGEDATGRGHPSVQVCAEDGISTWSSRTARPPAPSCPAVGRQELTAGGRRGVAPSHPLLPLPPSCFYFVRAHYLPLSFLHPCSLLNPVPPPPFCPLYLCPLPLLVFFFFLVPSLCFFWASSFPLPQDSFPSSVASCVPRTTHACPHPPSTPTHTHTHPAHPTHPHTLSTHPCDWVQFTFKFKRPTQMGCGLSWEGHTNNWRLLPGRTPDHSLPVFLSACPEAPILARKGDGYRASIRPQVSKVPTALMESLCP